MLSTMSYGGPAGVPPLLIAHGLFGSARNWGRIAKFLSADRSVTAVDMRNHGDSFWSDRHGYKDLAADLAASIHGQHDVLGHSMGGKAAMALALTQPERVRRLIVVDISPVTYTHTQADLIEAMQALDLTTVASRQEADAALTPAIEDPGVRAFLMQSLRLRDHAWAFNLDALRQNMPDIMSFPAFDTTFTGPTLFLAGADSDYIQEAHRDDIKRLFPRAVVEVIPNAGHWVHAEQPQPVIDAISEFLSK